MFPQSSQGHQRVTARLLPYLALLIGAFVLLNRQVPVEASTKSTMPAHVQQAVSPLMATPGLSATVTLSATSVISPQYEISKSGPVLYDRAFIKARKIFMPIALGGVTYKAGTTKPFAAAAFTEMQAKMPVNICLHITVDADCVRTREQYLLRQGELGITRAEGKLSIALSDLSTIVLTDVVGADASQAVSYLYLEYMPAVKQHRVLIAYYESADQLLINAETGETTVLPYASPMLSPDHKRFVATNQVKDAYLNVQIWNTQRPHLNLEADLIIENLGQQEPTKISWVDATQTRIETIEPSNQITGLITVTWSAQGWQAAYNGQKIATPVLHPQSIVNSSTVFGIETLGVGKRVYMDRAYKFKTVPTAVNGQQSFLFANNNMRNTEADYVHFTVAQPATVYVALDIEASELPGWLKDGWTPTPDILTTDDVVKLRLYKKTFDAGDEVNLGGNWAPPASEIRSHYLVIVAPN